MFASLALGGSSSSRRPSKKSLKSHIEQQKNGDSRHDGSKKKRETLFASGISVLTPAESQSPETASISISSLSGDDEATMEVAHITINEKDHQKSTLGGWKGWKKALIDTSTRQNKRRGSIWNTSEPRKIPVSMQVPISQTAVQKMGLPRDLGDLWVDKILPGWPEDNADVPNNQLLKSLICLGVPDEIRGEYWKRAIGNYLKLTTDLYRILLIKLCSVRAQLLQSSQRYTNGLHMCEKQLDDSDGSRSDHLDKFKAAILSRSKAIKRMKSDICHRTRLELPRASNVIRSRSMPALTGIGRNGHNPTTDALFKSVNARALDLFYGPLEHSTTIDHAGIDTPTSSARYEIEFIKKSFEAIAVDLHRTVPRHAQQNKTLLVARGSSFSPSSESLAGDSSSRGLLVSLRSILEAWVVYRPDIGYVQGMAYIAATLLFAMDEFSAFVCLANLLCKDTMIKFYRFELGHIRLYCRVFDLLLDKYFPHICHKIQNSSFTSDVFLVEWWFTLFTRSLPPNILHRVWDHYLIDGDIVLFQTALGIVKYWHSSLEQLPIDEGLLLLTSGIKNFDALPQPLLAWPQFVTGIQSLHLSHKVLQRAFIKASRPDHRHRK